MGTAARAKVDATATYKQHKNLRKPLPDLVRQQRRLAATIAKVAQQVKDEKAIRDQIDQLLVAAGLKKGDLVTCLGYDVRHNERDGQKWTNTTTAVALLVKGGVDPEFAAKALADSEEQGEVAKFATVTPSKGAKVRAPVAA